MLLLTAMNSLAQSQTQQEDKKCKVATNAAAALSNFDLFNSRIDTAAAKQDSMMKVWQDRIDKLQERFNAKKTE